MKKINPDIFPANAAGYDLHGDLNYPTFMKELMLRPIKEMDYYKGKVTICIPHFDEAFYERISKYGIKKVNWHGTVRVMSKDLIDYE